MDEEHGASPGRWRPNEARDDVLCCERCWGEAGDGTGPVDEAWKTRTTTLERMSMVDVTSLLSAERRARRGDGSDERDGRDT